MTALLILVPTLGLAAYALGLLAFHLNTGSAREEAGIRWSMRLYGLDREN